MRLRIAIMLLLGCSPLLAQGPQPKTTVPIWPDLAPGETSRGRGETLPFRPQEKPPVSRVVKIRQPTLDIFPAPQPNGVGVLILPGFDQQQHWLVMRAGQLIYCTAGHADSRTPRRVVDTAALEPDVPRTNLGINLLLLMSSWLKKHPEYGKAMVAFDEIAARFSQARSA